MEETPFDHVLMLTLHSVPTRGRSQASIYWNIGFLYRSGSTLLADIQLLTKTLIAITTHLFIYSHVLRELFMTVEVLSHLSHLSHLCYIKQHCYNIC